MAYDQTTLRNRVFALLGGTNDFYGTITGTINSSATTVPVNDGTDWEEGDVLEFLPDGERARVISVSSNNLTVDRGEFGTAAAAHTSGDAIKKNPSIPITDVHDAIEVTMQNLWPYAWKVAEDTITPSSATWFDLNANVIDLVSVNQIYNTTELGSYGDKSQQHGVIFQRNLPTALVASGNGLAFPGGLYDSSNTIYVKYRARFTGEVSGGAYQEFSVGPAVEVIAHGAAARIAMATEGPKVMAQDQAQGERGVASGDRVAFATVLFQRYQELLNSWYSELVFTSGPMGELR